MKKVWMLADSIVSPLGTTTQENFDSLRHRISGLKRIDDKKLSASPIHAGYISAIKGNEQFTRFEMLCIEAIRQVLAKTPIDPANTLFILSTTKGNISLLEEGDATNPRIHLHETAAYLSKEFGFKNHLVISNACISGVMALLIGKRMIEADNYESVVVVGADVLSRFVISGFQSLQALSPDACRPFDASRKGINLGECAAAVVLSANKNLIVGPAIQLMGGGLSNDANHISGPSRTGEELGFSIQQALKESGLTVEDIDFISAHGTATVYNDEMEAKAFNLMKMGNTPLNSLKGYYGHTLGAAGVLEAILSAESLRHDELIPTAGFENLGVTQPVHVIHDVAHRALQNCLKTASGFGGCNAAIILHKDQ